MTTDSVRVLIWMPEWQQSCCGAAFTVGESVAWNVFQLPEERWKRTADGEVIRHIEDHHSDHQNVLAGTVKNVRQVVPPGADGIVQLGAALDGLPSAEDMKRGDRRGLPASLPDAYVIELECH